MADEIFQYKEPTVSVGNYEFDASALNAYIRRAWSVYGVPTVKYKMINAAFGDPSKGAGEEPMYLDCSGFAYFSTYRKRLGWLWDATSTAWKQHWVEIPYPIAGCAIRHDAYPGKSNGHVGFVVEASKDNFQTLDSSSSATPPRQGSIRHVKDGKSFWMKAPNVRFVVSTQALKSVNGVPYKPSLNVYLAAAKRPILSMYVGITAALAAIIAVAGVSYALVSRKRKNLPLLPFGD